MTDVLPVNSQHSCVVSLAIAGLIDAPSLEAAACPSIPEMSRRERAPLPFVELYLHNLSFYRIVVLGATGIILCGPLANSCVMRTRAWVRASRSAFAIGNNASPAGLLYPPSIASPAVRCSRHNSWLRDVYGVCVRCCRLLRRCGCGATAFTPFWRYLVSRLVIRSRRFVPCIVFLCVFGRDGCRAVSRDVRYEP